MIAARRHDFLRVDPAALRDDPRLADWAGVGRPFVQRAGIAPEGMVLLGWCPPPGTGPRRVGFAAPASAILGRHRPPHLGDAIGTAPEAWQGRLRQMLAEGQALGLGLRIYGSLAWSAFTGLPYLREGSDLDLLIEGWGRGDPTRETAFLTGLQTHITPRIDGEIVLPTGEAISWREMLGTTPQVLLRGMRGPRLVSRAGLMVGAAA